MDVTDGVLEYVKTVTGVLDAYVMDDEVSKAVLEIERSVRTQTNSDYKNLGYEEAIKRQFRVCIFYDDTYIFGKRSILKLMSSDGTIMGTNLSPDEIELYRGRDDVIWVSEDFIMFTDVVGKGDEAFVLLPFPIEEIEESVPGSRNVIGTSPTMSSDTELKRVFHKPMIRGVYTMIVAFDAQ